MDKRYSKVVIAQVSTIRAAAPRDYDQVISLLALAHAHHVAALPDVFLPLEGPARPPAWYEELLASPEAQLLVADAGDCLAGLVHVVLRQAPAIPIMVRRRYGFIDNLVVRPEHRGQGLGRALMAAAHHWVLGQGVTEVELNVYEFNQEAIALYERLGYATASRRMVTSLPPTGR